MEEYCESFLKEKKSSKTMFLQQGLSCEQNFLKKVEQVLRKKLKKNTEGNKSS